MPALIRTLTALALAARERDIGLTVDAEEADRLEISLDVFAAVLADPRLTGWDGLGLAVQAYQKRGLRGDRLGRRARPAARHRIPVRLVKGAYWDSEIKLAQVQGYPDYPVFTRKAGDRRELACLRAPYAGLPRCDLSGIRHAQRAQPGVRAGMRRRAISKCSGCTAWARRCTTHASDAGAGLCAGRHARGPAGVSGAPTAGEWRQYQLRASPGRSVGARGGDRRRPGDAAARARRRPPIRAFPCRAISIRTGSNSAGFDLADRAATPGLLAAAAPRADQRSAGGARKIRNPAIAAVLVGGDRRCRRQRRSTRR